MGMLRFFLEECNKTKLNEINGLEKKKWVML